MGCNCGGHRSGAGRALVTSGDYQPPPTPEPLAVLPSDQPAPEGATYRVVLNGTTAYFTDHGGAFDYQQDHGGRVRTVQAG